LRASLGFVFTWLVGLIRICGNGFCWRVLL
jgi:hypothetical protein